MKALVRVLQVVIVAFGTWLFLGADARGEASQQSASVKTLRPAAGVALLLAGSYSVALLTFLLFLSVAPVNQFSRVVGAPSWGFGLTLTGGLILACLGTRAARRRRRDKSP